MSKLDRLREMIRALTQSESGRLQYTDEELSAFIVDAMETRFAALVAIAEQWEDYVCDDVVDRLSTSSSCRRAHPKPHCKDG